MKAKACQFENLKDSMIIDRLVLGVTNTRVQERLFREDNLNLENAVKIRQAAEATERQIQSLSTEKGASSSEVNYCQNTARRQHGKSQQKNAAKCKYCDTMPALLLIRHVTSAEH